MAGVHGDRLLVIVVAGANLGSRRRRPTLFGDGPVVRGRVGAGLAGRHRVARPTPWSGYRVAAAWLDAPRAVDAADLLPERVLAGDRRAAAELLRADGLRAAGRRPRPACWRRWTPTWPMAAAWSRPPGRLFVHPNTVRYRLRRIAEITGRDPWDPRDLLALQIALILGRIDPQTTADLTIAIGGRGDGFRRLHPDGL